MKARGSGGRSVLLGAKKLRKPVSLEIAKAGTVRLRLQPTNFARGILELKQPAPGQGRCHLRTGRRLPEDDDRAGRAEAGGGAAPALTRLRCG